KALWLGVVPGNGFKDHLAGLAVRVLNRVYQAGTAVGSGHNPIYQQIDRFRKVNFQKRFWRGELEKLPILKQPIETLLPQIEQAPLEFIGNGYRRRRFLLSSCFLFLGYLLRLASEREQHVQTRACGKFG